MCPGFSSPPGFFSRLRLAGLSRLRDVPLPRGRPSASLLFRRDLRAGAARTRRSSRPLPPGASAKRPACRSSGCRWRRSSTTRRRASSGRAEASGPGPPDSGPARTPPRRRPARHDSRGSSRGSARGPPGCPPAGKGFVRTGARRDRAIHGEPGELLSSFPGGWVAATLNDPVQQTTPHERHEKPPDQDAGEELHASPLSSDSRLASLGMVAARGVAGHLRAALDLDGRVVDPGLFLEKPSAPPARTWPRPLSGAAEMWTLAEWRPDVSVQKCRSCSASTPGNLEDPTRSVRRRSRRACLRAGRAPTA